MDNQHPHGVRSTISLLKWTHKQIAEHLGINDKDRVKVWMRKYRKQGEFGLLDERGRREVYLDQDRYVHKIEREV
ncbi:helix-turn-helix domain-containing protein [Brevibacterium sp. JNUCC-42]|nr:helix-turn-helix domain-containing protein [Brevibacterium sp. JNUCC-42]